MPEDAYDPASIRVLAGIRLSKRDPNDPVWRWAGEFLAQPTLSTDALLVIAQWRGRPDAALNAVRDVFGPASRAVNRSLLPALGELTKAGLVERTQAGLVLTAAGKAALAEMA